MSESVNRRGLFKRAAGAAVAAPFVGKAMAEDAVDRQSPFVGGHALHAPQGIIGQVKSAYDDLPEAAKKIIAKRRRRDRWHGRSYDDIDAMRSWAPWFKREMAISRAEAESNILAELLGHRDFG